MNAVHCAALEYAELGFRVFPLCPGTKKPIIKGWPKQATCDLKTINRWFLKWPDANLGIATGHGLIVIDVDPRNGGIASYEELCRRGMLPETVTAFTGRGDGGTHLAYRSTANLRKCPLAGFPGIDVVGDGGYIVAAPSIHPDTSQPYVWARPPQSGMAKIPDELVELIRGQKSEIPQQDREADRPAKSRTHHKATPKASCPVAETGRQGNVDVLAAELIANPDYTIKEYGKRHPLMVKAVVMLMARGYDNSTVERAVDQWSRHYHVLGRVRTPPADALAEIQTATRWFREHGLLKEIDHRTACQAIQLTEAQRSKMKSPIEEQKERGGEHPTNSIGLTPIRGRLCDLLCGWDHEFAFVEALIVHATYEIGIGPGETIKATDKQIVTIASDRYPSINWAPPQIERLKSKYIARPGKPAKLDELLVEVEKGKLGKGGRPGTPSVYRPTGLVRLLSLAERR